MTLLHCNIFKLYCWAVAGKAYNDTLVFVVRKVVFKTSRDWSKTNERTSQQFGIGGKVGSWGVGDTQTQAAYCYCVPLTTQSRDIHKRILAECQVLSASILLKCLCHV